MDVEDGSLTGAALRWSIDGRAIGTGQDQIVEGLAPGTYTVTLTATDGSGNERSTSAPLTVAPLSVPGGGAPTLDGACDDPAYAGATRLQLPAYSDGTQATTQLIHTSTDLWVCLSGMARSSAESGSLAGIHVDINNSRDPVAQADDYGFLVGEDGTPLTQSGDSKGGFVQGGPSGLTSRIGADATSWSAELRIPVSALGGWDRVVGLEVGQYNLSTTGDGYHWPVRAGSAEPNTWARTVLGAIPEITDISPASAMAGDPALSLTVTGANFGPDMAVQWAGELRPTTFISSTQLVAAISSGDLATGGSIPVTISSPSLSTVTSNAATFSVNNPIPSISSVTSPGWSSEGMTLAINGTNFVSGTQIIVNGLALPTMVLSSTQLVALASSADLKGMKVVSIAALNSAPGGGLSNAIPFKVIYRVFLPFAIGGTEPANGPDLVGSISISPNKRTFSAGEPVTITATITNVGNAPTGAFWADLFINPSQPPTTANVRWNDVCKLQPCFGIAWTVSDGLAPGQSITLTSRSYPAGYSLWPGWFASGTTDLYLYVDTWNPGVPYGTVAEYNEANNGTALHGLIVSGKNPTQPNLSETMDLLPRPTLKNT
jgi:hypothetical protein